MFWRTTFSATAVATYAFCPRRARFLDASVAGKLENDLFGTAVRRALHRAVESRIAKEAYDLAFVLHREFGGYGSVDDLALFERARSVAGLGLQTLARFAPVGVDLRFSKTIGAVRVIGTVDLAMRRDDGKVLALAIKTGDIPEAAFALELALARVGLKREFADAAYAVVAASEGGVIIREPTLPALAEVESRVAAAAQRHDDAPRPGSYCASCPVASSCPAVLAN